MSASSSKSITDLADWAEDCFSGLCSFAGVTRNKSGQDRTGWDYLIEFPVAKMPNVPADLRPAEQSARVQIKSKRSGRPIVTMSLSNALRFANDPLPCFIVLFLANDGRQPVRIFAKHFWQDEIGRSLKRARKAHADGKEDHLNKQTVTINLGSLDEHTNDLVSWMMETIAQCGAIYAEAKANIVRSVGFEEGRFHGLIEFKVDDLQAFVDHQIGLHPRAPPLVVRLKERRFGIDSVVPLFEGTPDFASIQSCGRPCRVRVRGSTGNDVWLDGTLFGPAMPNLPREFCKLRIVADFIEMVLTVTETGDVTFHIDDKEQRSLPGLRALMSILRAAKEGPIIFQVSVVGSGAITFTVRMPDVQMGPNELEQLSHICDCLAAASEGVLPAGLTLSIAEIYEAWNSIVDFNGMVTGTDFKGKFTFAEELPAFEHEPTGLIFYGYVDVGSWTFMAVVRRPIEKFEISGRQAILQCGSPRVLESIVRHGPGQEHLRDLRTLHSGACKMEGEGVIEICGGDFRAALSTEKEFAKRRAAQL